MLNRGSFSKKGKKEFLYLRWLYGYTRPYLKPLGCLFILGLINSFITIYFAILSKQIIDSALDGSMNIRFALVYIVLSLIVIFLTAMNSVVSVELDESFSFSIRKKIYDKILRSLWRDISSYHTGDLMTRLTSDVSSISNGIVYTVPNIFNLIFQLILTFLILCYYDVTIALLGLVIAPTVALVSFVLGRKLKNLQVKVQETESTYRSFLQESLSKIAIVKAFEQEEEFGERLTGLRIERFRWIKKRTRMRIGSSSLMRLAFEIGYILAFVYGALRVSQGAITYGTMTVFIILVNRIQSPIFELAKNIPKIISTMASTGRIIELENIPSEIRDEEEGMEDALGINIRDLSYSYDRKQFVFKNASLKISPGEFIGITGESGIGKTTLIRLVMGFIESNEGSIHIYGTDGRSYPVTASTRKHIAYVPQGNSLFSGSIEDNIRIANKEVGTKEIEQALRQSCAYEFIEQWPEGIKSIIGENGIGLSEGQAQRIAIARALVKKAQVIIFDEATSALDEKTERELLINLSTIRPRPTCLLITHRLKILDYCDHQLEIINKKLSYKN